jgi:YD repeat-containing protein
VTFHDTSTIAYTYDAGDRQTQMVDSANGTITRQYEGLDRLTQETTPQGTVNYTYDAAGRRTTMTVVGQRRCCTATTTRTD